MQETRCTQHYGSSRYLGCDVCRPHGDHPFRTSFLYGLVSTWLGRQLFFSRYQNDSCVPESQRMLVVHPDSASQEGRRRSGCNEDDAYVYAYASYSYPGRRADIMSFYSAAAQKDGWRPLDLDSRAASSAIDGLCFNKPLKGASVYLSVLADGGDGANGKGVYSVTAWAVHGEPPSDDEVMC